MQQSGAYDKQVVSLSLIYKDTFCKVYRKLVPGFAQ